MTPSPAAAPVELVLARRGDQLTGEIWTCLNCGQDADARLEVIFEDSGRPTLAGHAASLATRTRLVIPVCRNCARARESHTRHILVWAGVFLLVMAAAFFVITRFDPKLESGWSFAALLGSLLYPMDRLKHHWMLKDRGGDFLECVRADETSVTLRFLNPAGAAAIQRSGAAEK